MEAKEVTLAKTVPEWAAKEVRKELKLRRIQGDLEVIERLCDDYDILQKEADKQALRIDELESQILHQDA